MNLAVPFKFFSFFKWFFTYGRYVGVASANPWRLAGGLPNFVFLDDLKNFSNAVRSDATTGISQDLMYLTNWCKDNHLYHPPGKLLYFSLVTKILRFIFLQCSKKYTESQSWWNLENIAFEFRKTNIMSTLIFDYVRTSVLNATPKQNASVRINNLTAKKNNILI